MGLSVAVDLLFLLGQRMTRLRIGAVRLRRVGYTADQFAASFTAFRETLPFSARFPGNADDSTINSLLGEVSRTDYTSVCTTS